MENATDVYRKQNSFHATNCSGSLEETRPRLEKVLREDPQAYFSDGQNNLLKTACKEALGLTAPEKGFTPFQLHPFNLDEIDRLPDAELPRYLLYRYRYDVYPARRILDDYPPCVQIEPSSICNYRCVFCYQVDEAFTDKSSGMMGSMSLEMFKSLIDRLEGRCEAVTLASRGEPLICPDIEAMLDYAGGKFLALKINTNAWFLDEAKCHAILRADVGSLVFSADAVSEPAYSQLRVNGNLERVYKNIRRFREIRARHYPKSRVITRVSGVRYPKADSLQAMKTFWAEMVDQVALVEYNPWENIYERPANDISEACSDLWRRLFIWWDGTANPCDSDYKSTLKMAQSEAPDVREIWRSEAYEALRRDHLVGARKNRTPCNSCQTV